MFKRLKRTLVESYVGAIALGYLLAEVILYFVNIFVAPVAGWVSRSHYERAMPRISPSAGLSFQDSLPNLERFLILLLVWYLLLRWLYFKSVKEQASAPPNPEESV